VTVIEGAAGTGKTRLAFDLAENPAAERCGSVAVEPTFDPSAVEQGASVESVAALPQAAGDKAGISVPEPRQIRPLSKILILSFVNMYLSLFELKRPSTWQVPNQVDWLFSRCAHPL
jgi:hypothetical protein